MLNAHIIAICYDQNYLQIFKIECCNICNSPFAIRLMLFMFPFSLVSFSPFFAFHLHILFFYSPIFILHFMICNVFPIFFIIIFSFAFFLWFPEPVRIVFGLISLALTQSTNNSNKSTKKVRTAQIKFLQKFISKCKCRCVFVGFI